jgi:hypothetical protein
MTKEIETMNVTRSQRSARLGIGAIAVAAMALILSAVPAAQAAGLTNCIELTGRSGACYESVWANGVQLRMTFPQRGEQFPGVTASDKLDKFYVLAPQTDTAQGSLPFPHDHVVRDVPAHNHGAYTVQVHGFFVLCSGQGIATGGCVPALSSIEGLGTLPLARTANGQDLTSVDAIESAAASGLIVLIDTGAVLIGTINAGG